MEIHDRLREVRVTGVMAVFFLSMLLGLPFAVAWAMDDGNNNQPFPEGLRQLVLVAAALHFGAVAFRLLKAVWKWEPIGLTVGRLLGGYGLLAVTFVIGWIMHDYGVKLLAHFVLTLPAGWGFYLLGRAMVPGTAGEPGPTIPQ